VSLRGSPTVSPTTAAMCCSLTLLPSRYKAVVGVYFADSSSSRSSGL
jgi:hypothetical protein